MGKDLLDRARALAREAHASQFRKEGNVPYFVHLEAVATVLSDHGVDDQLTLAAAYLHDLLEDQPAHADRFRAEMPEEVIEAVEAVSEQKLDRKGRTRPKAARFADYLEGLRSAGARARMVSCADKIDNTRSLVASADVGSSLFMRLRTRPGQYRAQLTQLRPLYRDVVPAALLATFDELTEEFERVVEAWLPSRAVHIAAEAHLGQLDKGGQPYIDHPLRLRAQAESRSDAIVAVLHDVVEDSGWTIDRLRAEGFSEATLRSVEHLTRRADEEYAEFIERVALDRCATRIKLLDLADNSDLSRIPHPTDEDRGRIAKYARASERLHGELKKRSLWISLDDESRNALEEIAVFPVVRATHVTLVHRVDPDRFEARWIPGGHSVGDRISFRAVGDLRGPHVQLAHVAVDKDDVVRPFDGGTLHVTVSRVDGARSRESNDVTGKPTPLDIPLSGVIEWVE